MPFVVATLNLAVDAIATAGAYISAHTGDPSTTGANEVAGGSYARQLTTWATAANGERVGSQVNIPIPASTTVTHWGIWSAASSGTFRGGFALSAGETFGSAGTLQHTPTLDVNAV